MLIIESNVSYIITRSNLNIHPQMKDFCNVVYTYNEILFNIKEILIHATMWTKPEDITKKCNKPDQKKKKRGRERETNIESFHLHDVSRVVKFRQKVKWWLSGVGGSGKWGVTV